MAYLAIDKNGQEAIYLNKPIYNIDKYSKEKWNDLYETNEKEFIDSRIDLPNGTIKKILGYTLTYKDSPILI